MSVANDKYLLIRCPHTGSTDASVIAKRGGGLQIRGGVDPHWPIWAMPEDWTRGRRSVSTWRDPFAWYPSHWASCVRNGKTSLSFRDFLHGATHGDLPKQPFRLFSTPWVNGTHVADSGLGLCSFMHFHFYGERFPSATSKNATDIVVRTPDIRARFRKLFGARAVKGDRRNVGPYEPPEWDDEMRAWVTEKDAPLIAFLGSLPE